MLAPAMSPASVHDGRRRRLRKRFYKLRDERQAVFDPIWRDIAAYQAPGFGRYWSDDLNTTGREDVAILDNTAEHAAAQLAAMIMAYSTSPARPWFKLATVDVELSRDYEVRLWLEDTTQRMQRVFARSNTYAALHQAYEELVYFGNSCTLIERHPERLIHLHPITSGLYVWATDFRNEVNTMMREFKLTVGQLVAEFGFDKVCESTRNRFTNQDYDSQVSVIHVIEPRMRRDVTRRDNLDMPWRSVYFEAGRTDDASDEVLRESGFQEFPVLAGRWRVIGGDTYARGPGWMALGDAKSLQHLQERFGLCIDLQTDPPLAYPPNLTNRFVDGLPGGRNPSPDGAGIRSIFEVNLDTRTLLDSIRDHRERINRAYFVDIMLMLSSGGSYPQKTAEEIRERHEEKLMVFGPVQQRMENEIQKPLIRTTLGYMIDAGLVAPLPPQLFEAELNVEFLSVFAQTQRQVNLFAVDRFLNSLGAISALRPDALDKLNADRLVDTYAEDLGLDPAIINSDREMRAVREARAKQQAALQQTAAMAAQAKATKDLATAPTGERSALTDVLGNLTGYLSPSTNIE